jgi:hypothetical protein
MPKGKWPGRFVPVPRLRQAFWFSTMFTRFRLDRPSDQGLRRARNSSSSLIWCKHFKHLPLFSALFNHMLLVLADKRFGNFRGFRPSMRRSPKVLEQERRVQKLIALANRAAPKSAGDASLQELIEDSAYPVSATASRKGPIRSVGRNATPAHAWDVEDPKTYEALVGRVRAKRARGQEAAFAHFLRELFTAIARAGAAGPLEPELLDLPDPVSFRRLAFEPNGTMRIHDSPLRVRFEQLYRDLGELDGTRIRECLDCGTLFWAQRKDRVGCSKPCANRLRFSNYYWSHQKGKARSQS